MAKKYFILFIAFCALYFQSYGQGKSLKTYSFCQEYMAAEKMLELAWKYKGHEETKTRLLLKEAHNSIINARNIYREIKPRLSSRLSLGEINIIESSLTTIRYWTAQTGNKNQIPLMIELSIKDKKMMGVLYKVM